MRFLLLMAEADHFDKWEAADDAHRERVYADFRAFDEAVRTRGSIVGGDALDRPSSARTVLPGDGRPVTDGPYAETVEQVSGFFIVECDDLDTVVEAARLMLEGHNRLEIRPRPTEDQS